MIALHLLAQLITAQRGCRVQHADLRLALTWVDSAIAERGVLTCDPVSVAMRGTAARAQRMATTANAARLAGERRQEDIRREHYLEERRRTDRKLEDRREARRRAALRRDERGTHYPGR